MKQFNNLLPSKKTKSKYKDSFASLVCYRATTCGVKLVNNFKYLEQLCIYNLLRINKESKKYKEDLVTLWAKLDMKAFLDFTFELTVNPYLGNVPVNKLDHYPINETKQFNLLDIKLIDKIKLYDIVLKKIYIATYEIMDEKYNAYRPYVELYQKDGDNFKKLGYGYDTHDNKLVELIIDDFNYSIYLTPEGEILLPFKNKKVKLSIYNDLTDDNIQSIISKIYLEDLIIK